MTFNIEDEFDRIKTGLFFMSPFMGSMMRRCRVMFTRSIPTAAVNANYVMLVNPDFFEKLGTPDRIFILAHETMHIAFNHVNRGTVEENISGTSPLMAHQMKSLGGS